MATGDATWQVGTFTVPSSASAVSVTGMPGTPAAVFFFGTNWLTEDTAVTSGSPGMFRGMAAPKFDSPSTILQTVGYVAPAGDCHGTFDTDVIITLNSVGSGSTLYRASFTSFNSDGFTVTFSTGASGGYKVVYAALMDVASCGAGTTTSGNATAALGFKAGSAVMQGAWAGPNVTAGDRSQEYYGSAAYPGTGGGSFWFSTGLSASTFPTSISGQYDIGIFNDSPGTAVCHTVTFTGPFLSAQNLTAIPTGTGLTSYTINTNLSDNWAMFVAWEDEDSMTGRAAPAPASSGNTGTVSGLSFAPGLVIGYTVSDEPDGQGTGSRGAIGFSVVADGFQWCAVADGQASLGAFQSFQRGFADAVSGTNVHAGTIDLTSDGFVMTTHQDAATAQDWSWHAFGHPARSPAAWIPQIYRRVAA